MAHVLVRPSECRAWHGQSLLITDVRGDAGAGLPLSGFYFRETRFLRTLRLTVNGQAPWLCETASPSPRELCFAFAHPEVEAYGGGGTGQSQDETPVDELGIP